MCQKVEIVRSKLGPSVHAAVLWFALLALLTALTAGCGGSGGSGPPPTPPPAPDFTLSVAPDSATLVPGGQSQQLQVSVQATGGFNGSVSVGTSGLPSGVTAAPESFSLLPAQNQAVVLTAASNATVGSSSLTLTGVSGSTKHTAQAMVSVQTPPSVSSPTRTTFVRNDSLTVDDMNSTPFQLRLGIYDIAHKNFFVSNTFLNRVEVYSATTEQLVTSISVPSPVGMDLTMAGDKLYVGSISSFLYVIDPTKLKVIQRVSTATMLPGSIFSPVEPLALSDGRIFMLTSFGVDGSTKEVVWNPATGAGQDITSLIGIVVGQITRSGDHSKLLMASNDSGGAMVLYDVGTGATLTGASGVGITEFLAGNQDGSRWYVAGTQGMIAVFDGQLHMVKQATQLTVQGMMLSRDQQTLYAYTEIFGYFISALDATTLSFKGWISSFQVEGFIGPVEMKDMDETGLIFGVQDHGVGFADTTTGLHGGSQNLGFNLGYLKPDNAPLNTPTPMQAVVLAGVNSDLSQPNVFFGPTRASGTSLDPTKDILTTTAPASPFPGPVNVITTQTSGNFTLLPSGFSYGPTLVYTHTNASAAQGGGPGEVFAFGAGTNAGSVQIGVGSSTAVASGIQPGNAFLPYPFLNLQKLPYTIPAGTPGSVSLSLTAPSGTAMQPSAFHYYGTLQQFPLANARFQQGVYDPTRKVIYFTNVDHIELFSPPAQNWLSPILLPAGKSPRALMGIGLSPNGNVLAVGDTGNGSILVFNPDQPTQVREFSVQVNPDDMMFSQQALGLAAIDTGVYFVMGNRCAPGRFRKLDPSTGTVTLLADGCSEPHDRSFRSRDGSTVMATVGGSLLVLNVTTGQVTNPFFAPAVGDTADLALAADGTRLSEAEALLDGNFDVTGSVAYIDAEVQDVQGQFGQRWLASGSLLLQPLGQQVDVTDGNTGRLRDRISLPVTLAGAFDNTVLDEPDDSLFLITTNGIAKLPLDQLPLGLGTVNPPQGPSGGGTAVTVRGNGFVAGTQVTVDGQAVSTTFLDGQTLTFVAPTHSAGGVRVAVNNPDGQTVGLDAAFVYTGASSQPGARTVPSPSAPPTSRSAKPFVLPPAAQRFCRPIRSPQAYAPCGLHSSRRLASVD